MQKLSRSDLKRGPDMGQWLRGVPDSPSGPAMAGAAFRMAECSQQGHQIAGKVKPK